MFYVISPLFSIINLIGIFQIISVMKAVLSLLYSAVLCYFFSDRHDKIDKEYGVANPFNFFNFFMKNQKGKINF